MRVPEGQRWEQNPRESPLYTEHPNTDCDEHGVLRPRPYWNTARKRVYKPSDKFCDNCGMIVEHKDNICLACGTHFQFSPVKGMVH
jgi:ribosomal protein S27AE